MWGFSQVKVFVTAIKQVNKFLFKYKLNKSNDYLESSNTAYTTHFFTYKNAIVHRALF